MVACGFLVMGEAALDPRVEAVVRANALTTADVAACKDALACVMWDACAGVCHGHCSTSRIPELECSNLL